MSAVRRWRPMKTAPKDGTHILLAYPSFNDDDTGVVAMGCWVSKAAPEWMVMQAIGDPTPEHLQSVQQAGGEPHWRVTYLSFRLHTMNDTRGYEARSVRVSSPLGWLPLPEVSARMVKRERP